MPSIFDDYLGGLDVNLSPQYGANQGANYGPNGKRMGGSGAWIREGYAPSFQYIKEGSQAAAGLLRQGWEERYRARAAGFAGSQAEQERGLGSQIASQGLAPDVASRLLLEQRTGGIQNLAAARGESAFGLDQQLAELAKGTGTELAGLNRDQFAQIVNYIMGKKALQAGKQAALYSAIGSTAGSAAGVYAAGAGGGGGAPPPGNGYNSDGYDYRGP